MSDEEEQTSVVQKKEPVDPMLVMKAVLAGNTAAVSAYLRAEHGLLNYRTADRTTLLHAACASGSAPTVALLLKKGADVAARDAKFGLTPLHEASIRGFRDIVQQLLAMGANINTRSKKGWTPFFYAIMADDISAAQFLLDLGSDLNAADNEGLRAIHVAVINGHTNMLDFLLGKGCDINERTTEEQGNTPLMLATAHGHIHIAERLLYLGADSHLRNHEDRSTLSCATTKEMKKLLNPANVARIEAELRCPQDCKLHAAVGAAAGDIEVLHEAMKLKNKLPINHTNTKGQTAVLCAVIHGHTAAVRELLVHEADPSVGAADGMTCLHHAARGQHELSLMLVHHSPALVNVTAADGTTALFCASTGEIAALLIERGAAIEARSSNGRTALFSAAGQGYPEVVAELLKHHASVKVVDEAGVSPLHLAAEMGADAVVEQLIDAGVRVDVADTTGATPLHAAARGAHVDTCRRLLLRGALINGLTLQWWTPLHMAASQGNVEVATLLLEKGANMEIVTQDGRTCMQIAQAHQHYRFCERVQRFVGSLVGTGMRSAAAPAGLPSQTSIVTNVPSGTLRHGLSSRSATELIEQLITNWAHAYMACVKYEGDNNGVHEVCVIWSKPTPAEPIPAATAVGHFRISTGRGAGDTDSAPTITYWLEKHDMVQTIGGSKADSGIFSEAWLDLAIRSKLQWRNLLRDI